MPEIGGRIDPDSEAHDMAMTLFGGLSKGERTRIKSRVHAGMASLTATEGRFLGGRPPYGYLLADAGPHPNAGKAADGKRLRRLAPDPVAAPIVRRIFEEYVDGRGIYAIAEGLTRDAVPSPSAHDPARNKHRRGSGGAWSKGAVRAILRNPRYTGRAYWNRSSREERLFVKNARTESDVAQGHVSRFRANGAEKWVFSAKVVHEPLVDPDLFERAQEVARTRPPSEGARKPQAKSGTRPYVLRGLVRCGLCERRMQGVWLRKEAYYRCAFPLEYALKARDDHRKRLYVREKFVVPALDEWLAQVFNPRNLDATIGALTAAAATDEDAAAARVEAARRKVEECDRKLAKLRAALEADGDPAVMGRWIREAASERHEAERELARVRPVEVDEAEIRRLVRALREPVKLLRRAPADRKRELYDALGVRLRYEPKQGKVLVEAQPGDGVQKVRVGGGI